MSHTPESDAEARRQSLPPIVLLPTPYSPPPTPHSSLPTTPAQNSKHKTRFPSSPSDIRLSKVREFLRVNSFEPNTCKAYEREMKRFLRWTDLPWTEITDRHIRDHYKTYLRDLGLAKSSCNQAIATLKSFFNWFCATYPDILAVSPAIGAKFERIDMPEAQSLTEEEMSRVWAALDQLGVNRVRDTMLVHILSHGLRAGEVVDLNLGAYDDGILFIRKSKTHRPRLAPLDTTAQHAVAAYLESRQASGEVLSHDRPLLLSNHPLHRGERLSYHGIYFVIEKLGELTNIPDLHPHRFRHTFATDISTEGLDPTIVKTLTGIESDIVLRRYTLRGEQMRAVKAFRQLEQRRASSSENG